MRIEYSDRFRSEYALCPPIVRKACDKQLGFLKNSLNHPSLHAKKYDESLNLWQARVTLNWRLYFTIEGGAYRLHKLTAHP